MRPGPIAASARRGFAALDQKQRPDVLPNNSLPVILPLPALEPWKERAENLDAYIHVIAKRILPNLNYRSNDRSLVFGRNSGSLYVTMSGQYAGQWYDFDDGRGGNAYELIREYTDRNGESAVAFGEQIIAQSRESPLCLIEQWMPDWAGKKTEDDDNDEVELIEGENDVTGIHGATVPLRPSALRYLESTRKIPLDRVTLSRDVRFLHQRQFRDCSDSIVVLARNRSNCVQALQHTYIKPNGTKALGIIPRRSRGCAKGSFVRVNDPRTPVGTPKSPVFFAEGLETALTVAAAFNNFFPVYQTMGKFNFHNIPEFLRRDTPVIAVADNDGPEKARLDPLAERLQKPGGPERYWIVRPDADLLGPNESDYNDFLRSGKSLEDVYQDIQRQVPKLFRPLKFRPLKS